MKSGGSRNQQGFVLVLVLWALLLLSVVGTSIAITAKERVWFASGHASRVEAQWAADAGMATAETRLAYRVVALAQLPGAAAASAGSAALEADPQVVAERRGWLRALNALDTTLAAAMPERLPNGAVYRTATRDATARLNLNAAGEPELRAFFSAWVGDERQLSILAESLLDWRDEDDLARAQGAEAEFYDRLPVPYPIRNGPLLSVREVLLVRGMTPELFQKVEPYLTVLPTRDLRINVNTAPAEVLAAVPGFSRELAQRLTVWRQRSGPVVAAAEITSVPELAALFDRQRGGGAALQVIALYPETVEVEALGQSASGKGEYRIQALYRLSGAAVQRLERRELAQ